MRSQVRLTRSYRGRYTAQLGAVGVEVYRTEGMGPGYEWAAEFDDQRTATRYGSTLRVLRYELLRVVREAQER